MGEEEANPTLELAMEYAGALGTIIFNESCHLYDLMEAQVGYNQFTIDVAVDRLDDKMSGHDIFKSFYLDQFYDPSLNTSPFTSPTFLS